MDKDTYKKHLRKNFTKTYLKINKNQVKKMNIEPKKIATKLKTDDRVQQFHEADTFISVKSHKDYFPNFPTFRLINPSK